MRVYVVGRHRWRGLSIGVCRKGVVETVGERPKEKNDNCMHEYNGDTRAVHNLI